MVRLGRLGSAFHDGSFRKVDAVKCTCGQLQRLHSLLPAIRTETTSPYTAMTEVRVAQRASATYYQTSEISVTRLHDRSDSQRQGSKTTSGQLERNTTPRLTFMIKSGLLSAAVLHYGNDSPECTQSSDSDTRFGCSVSSSYCREHHLDVSKYRLRHAATDSKGDTGKAGISGVTCDMGNNDSPEEVRPWRTQISHVACICHLDTEGRVANDA